MALINGGYVEVRYIDGVMILGTDEWAPKPGSMRACELYAKFGPAMEEARKEPDIWVICDQSYTFRERILKLLGFSFEPKYLRQAVVLDSKTGRYQFALAEDVELARKRKLDSKSGVA